MTKFAVALLIPASLALAVWCFRGIVRRYRTLLGFPWLLSVSFAAAAIATVLALHVLFET